MRGRIDLVVLLVGACLAVPLRAAADTVLLAAAGGASTDGPVARGEVGARASFLIGSVRVVAAGAGDPVQVTALVGAGPRLRERPAVATRWNRDCVDELRTAGAKRRCAGVADRQATTRRSSGWLGAVAGVRQGTRTEALAALRIHPTDDVLGDVVELGVSGVIAGRDDMLFVHHARFAPGWYARAQLRLWYIAIAGEVGMTGLAGRTAEGAFRAETFASATIGVGVVL